MVIVAHADDDLLFMNPAVAHAIAGGAAVETIYVTAGDAGIDGAYWRDRERGIRAAYAFMARDKDEWTASTPTVAGKKVARYVLNSNREISLVFLRLPDGNGDGQGFDTSPDDAFRPARTSLYQLWMGRLDAIPVVGTWSSGAGESFTAAELTGVLGALMNEFLPTEIATLDSAAESASGQDFFYGREHSDHLHAAKFVFEAHLSYATRHQLVAYRDYNIADPPRTAEPENLTRAERDWKRRIFGVYSRYDERTCLSGRSCPTPAWMWRQYSTRQITSVSGWLASAQGGACLAAQGTLVTLHECAPVPEQRWTLEHNRVTIDLPSGPHCLQAVGASLQLRTCLDDLAGQRWTLSENGLLRGAGGPCLTHSDDDGRARVHLAPCQRRAISHHPRRYAAHPQQSWTMQGRADGLSGEIAVQERNLAANALTVGALRGLRAIRRADLRQFE